MPVIHEPFHPHQIAVKLPIWREAFLLRELLQLRGHPTFRGEKIPAGDGSAVITIPGFLCTDSYTGFLTKWLERIGYRAYPSGLEQNSGCIENLLKILLETIERAATETDGKVHLIGHSLGGILARIAAIHQPAFVKSVMTLGSPFRGIRVHPYILWLSRRIRAQVQTELTPHCFTGFCTCPAVMALQKNLPASIRHGAIYTKADGIVAWQACINDDPALNFEVSGTHSGLVFNPQVYCLIADYLQENGTAQELESIPSIAFQ